MLRLRMAQMTRQKMLLAALIAAAVTIPLPVNVNSIALILFVTACVIQQPIAELKRRLMVPSLWMIPAVYFLWICCSCLWDTSGIVGIRDVERYAMLFFIPAALAVIRPLPARVLTFTGAAFLFVTVIICLFCLTRSYLEYRVTGDNRAFFYHYLAGQADLNAIFLSNYCLAGIIWSLYYLFTDIKRSAFEHIIVAVLCLFLLFMILLLSSKLLIFLTLLSLLFFILYIGYLKKRLIVSILLVGLLIGSGFAAISHLGYVRWRIAVTSAKAYEGPEDNNNGLSIRLLMWNTAWRLVKAKPLLGYGVKGARTEVLDKYKSEGFELGYREGYHSHNQYLQSALMGGIPAFLLLVAMVVKLGWDAIRRKNLLLLLLLFHFLCESLIESTFEVQQELVFYILFLFLFYYHQPRGRLRGQQNELPPNKTS